MTAARSDLMALAEKLRRADVSRFPWLGFTHEVADELDRLAASQPDREAVARTLYKSRGMFDDTTVDLHFRWFATGSADAHEARMAIVHCYRDADAILSLLSGAGTKSDGRTRDSLSSEENEPVVTRACGPSDPSLGPDVKPAPIADSSECSPPAGFADQPQERSHEG